MKRMLLGLWTVLACAPAQQEVTFPVHAVVRTVTAPHVVGAYTVTLTRAQLGFGPVYWCATASAGSELCDQPLLEFASSATVDLLSRQPQLLGQVKGYTGVIHSAQYDHAQSWTVTSAAPMATGGAPDGHAMVLEGQVVGPVQSFTFRLDVDVFANRQGEMAVAYARTDATVGVSTPRVTVRLPLEQWLDGLDWAGLEAQATTTGMVHLEAGHPITQGLVLALTSNARPSFEWSAEP